jgi:hypothetical protein
MSSKVCVIIVAFSLYAASATNEAKTAVLSSKAAVEAMAQVFARSERAHSESMLGIMKSMSPQKAWQVLDKSNLTTPALIELHSDLHGQKAHLRQSQPKGYSGLDGARKLLNDMIYESMGKYDAEIAKCSEYYAEQCAAMEACRGQISASNYIAANSRSLILDSQATINKCQVDIPTQKQELKQHNFKCKHELTQMKTRLAVVEGDIKVLSMILKMTDCKAKSFMQEQKELALLHCQDPCTKTSFITFNQKSLKEKVSQLQSSVSHGLMKDSFKDLFEGVESLAATEYQAPQINKTQFNNPPVPRTGVPGNPCNDPNGGAPSAADKRAAKCTIAASPQCYKLQERFLLIQSGVKDERDNLLEEIDSMEKNCEETKNTLETQIQNDQDMLSEAQTKLGVATTKEANAGEVARQTEKEHEQLNNDLKKQMKTCSGNYINFETELCALKKIRGELYKMKGGATAGSAFFQDCQVSKWDPEECTKKCTRSGEQGGTQKLTRGVMTHPNGGAKCLPLAALKKCNLQPCPVDCRLAAWSGWSKCSAECGGGVQQRLREVKMAMRFGGKPCGETSDTKPCNPQACEKDCELSPWTKWTVCSKPCDGGTQKRQKFVKKTPEGEGKCADKWSTKRLQYKKCNMFGCLSERAGLCSTSEKDSASYTCKTVPTCCDGYTGMGIDAASVQCFPTAYGNNPQYKVKCGEKALGCDKKLDIVFLLDGSGSLGKRGWNAEIKAAQTFVDAFDGTGAKANMAVILYSGPRTWGGVYKCFGRNRKKVNMETTCKIKTVTHFTNDMPKVKKLITGLEWPRGSTLTSLALLSAYSELSLGRKDAQSIVVVITDGRPLSYRATWFASRFVRKAARLVWVPVTRYAPLRSIKRWATRRWQENVVQVKSFAALEKPEVVTHVVANICPKS